MSLCDYVLSYLLQLNFKLLNKSFKIELDNGKSRITQYFSWNTYILIQKVLVFITVNVIISKILIPLLLKPINEPPISCLLMSEKQVSSP